jgi:sulfur relay (sulfurtransferase) DsrC/TusE family protein
MELESHSEEEYALLEMTRVFFYVFGLSRQLLLLRKIMGRKIGRPSGYFLREVYKDWCLEIWTPMGSDLLWLLNRPGGVLK